MPIMYCPICCAEYCPNCETCGCEEKEGEEKMSNIKRTYEGKFICEATEDEIVKLQEIFHKKGIKHTIRIKEGEGK